MPPPPGDPPPILLLDVMDTLVEEPYWTAMPAFFGLSLKELQAVQHPRAWLDFEHGRIDEATFLERFFADGREFDHQAFLQAVTAGWRFLPGAEALLADLAAAGHELHALSNYPVWYRRLDEALGLSRFLRFSFVSCHTGVRKPHPEAYLGAARSLDVPPSRCLFVDDRESNCEAAEGVGMDAILARDVAAVRASLEERGLL